MGAERIIADIKEASEWVAKALTSSGYKADFSMQSLREIDRFFNDHSKDGQPVPGGLLSEDLWTRLFAIGSYVGEVMRRAYDGQWSGDDSDPEVDTNVELQFPGGGCCWPMQKVGKRYMNGPEDGIFDYAFVIGRHVKKT